MSDETTRRCNADKVGIDSFFTRHSSGKVISRGTGSFKLRNSEGVEWSIDANILEQEFTFADQYECEEKISRTALIEIIVQAPRTAMTVQFNKKPKHLDVAKALACGQGELTDRQWNAAVKKEVAGEERTMVGHHYGKFDEHQRLKFNEAGVGMRLVDLRTVNWAIINQVEYTVK